MLKNGNIGRRTVLGGMAAATLAPSFPLPVIAREKVIKLGYVSPRTGPLAPFAEADAFIINQVKAALRDGFRIGNRSIPVEILTRDSQSNPSRAAEVASALILSDEVDLMLVASTPETTNPVADQCEANETPCISTVAPWQPWFFTRGGKADRGFDWTYHFFWGLEDVIGVYTAMWKQVVTNKSVAGLFPNDGDGNAWGDKVLGFPPVLEKLGFRLTDSGRFQSLSDDFSAQIAAFKTAQAEIMTGVVTPPDFTTFWTQARQQGFRPKVASVGKALLFPVAIEALGGAGENLSSEIWWSPRHPFASSLTGETAGALADGYQQSTGRQWTQPLGFVHALFEVAVDVARRAGGPGERGAMREALAKTKLSTVVGPLDWTAGPVRNVAKTPLVGGQWRQGGAFKYDLIVTDNSLSPSIPVGGEMRAIA